ncbi:hypothetical protein [Antarctobacter heliothermus]|uniref:Uncharacterized protein n=1 Tax=Antarctobacter heliothermus TaxID=74033 RepID=A0A239IDR8_9RHOB|nr:hypothetical protein [Antarctobacter heliothermus]SNS91711.1 hypothetical protein SAMN04488078_10423 [Antarctobacter heliothermus]
MKLMTFAKLIALAAAVSASPALAWKTVHNPFGHDTKCDKVNCFTPGTAYEMGHYHYLKCKDPKKYLTYRGNVLQCVPYAHIAK